MMPAACARLRVLLLSLHDAVARAQNGKRSRNSAPGNAFDADPTQLAVDPAGNTGSRSPFYHMESESRCSACQGARHCY